MRRAVMGLATAEESRLALLHSLAILDTPPEASFDGLAALAAQLANCPTAAVSLIDRHRAWTKASYGIPAYEVPREVSICARGVELDTLLEIHDTHADPNLRTHPMVARGFRFYAAEPLRLDGHTLGMLCVMDGPPRRLTTSQRHALRHLAVAATELLRSRQRLATIQLERERLLDFAHASGDWMWETDAALRYTWISGAFESITGVSAASMIGRLLDDAPLLDGQGEPLPRGATLHSLLRSGQPFARAVTIKEVRRGRLVISRSAVPVIGVDGSITGWRGTTRDITERLRTNAAVREQELRLTKLSAQLPGALHQFHTDVAGRTEFLYASEGLRELFGVDPQALLQHPQRLFDVVLPEDRPHLIASIEASRRSVSPWRHEFRVRRPDGTVRWLASRATPERRADGGLVWHGFTADLTHNKRVELALRRSEERWSLAVEAAGIGVAEIDIEAGLVRLDERARRIHGFTSSAPWISYEQWINRIEHDHRLAAADGFSRALNEHRTLDLRYRVRRSDGTLRWVELAARAQYDDTGRALRLVGTCRDITEQHEAEQLRRDKQAAERANRAKSEFLSRMSHELRTPLNSIIGFTQLVAMDSAQTLGADQRKHLDTALRAAQHLLEMVNEVLDIARIDNGDLRLAPRSLHLSVVLANCLALIRPLATQHRVTLPEAPTAAPPVRADARALEQVVTNLLSNAIKYNRPGGAVKLEVHADASRVRLSVIDEGAGLNEAQLRDLFQPFNRLGAERTRIEGSGLGLVVARQLAIAMGGTIEVDSRPGAGSRFTLVLHAADAPPSEDPHPEPHDSRPPVVAAASPRRQVLYIEDEPVNVLLMEEVFRNQTGWALHVARDGTEGLALARRLHPDVLLIDMNLPDMSGADVVHALRSDPSTAGLHCIALSADAMREQIESARAAGFNDYWTKPIDVRRMVGALAEALENATPAK